MLRSRRSRPRGRLRRSPAGRAGPATGRGRSSSCRPSSCSGSGSSTRRSTRSSAASSGRRDTSARGSGSTTTGRCSRPRRSSTAIKNSAIWVAVVPAFVTAFGLLFAVLTERISWSVAFKTVIFLPMAISAFATGVTWRLMYQQNPDQGAINALGRTVSDAVTAPGVLSNALPSTTALQTQGGGLLLKTPLHPGGVALLGLTGIAPDGRAAGSAAGGEAGGTVRRDRGRRLARLQARRRQARRRRAGRARAPGRHGRAQGLVGEGRAERRRPTRTAASSSPASRPGRTTRASEPRPSRSPSAATRGSGRNSSRPRS